MSKKKITICILLTAIVAITSLSKAYFTKEKRVFTAPNDILAVFLGEEKSKTFPAKDSGYVYDHTECTNDEVATWNADTWKLTISKIKKETNCNVYFTLGFTEKQFAYKGSVEEFIVPVTGNYKLEVWGAQGGYRTTESYGGKGGYSKGIVSLEKDERLYVSVGGAGNNGGFNGGGTRQGFPNNRGGGATDIRIGENTLYHRVIVAGGGGSDGDYDGNRGGGYGGGASGQSKTETYGTGGAGGTQTSAGINGGSFGVGGPGLSQNSGYGGAGGGGWYGGGGVTPDTSQDDDRGGGGGSGWIYTETAFNAWQSGNPTDAANWKLNTKYYLREAETVAGNAAMPTHDGLGTMTGNSGDGCAKITLVR